MHDGHVPIQGLLHKDAFHGTRIRYRQDEPVVHDRVVAFHMGLVKGRRVHVEGHAALLHVPQVIHGTIDVHVDAARRGAGVAVLVDAVVDDEVVGVRVYAWLAVAGEVGVFSRDVLQEK